MWILEVRYSHSQKYTYDLVIIVYAEYKRFSLRQIYKIKLPYDNNRKFTVIFLYSWYYANIPDISSLLVTQFRDLVKRSARFVEVDSYNIMIIPADTDSLILWYETLQCFFFKVASALDVVFTTASLSQNMFASPSIGTPKDRSLYRRDIINSVAFLKATISDPKVEVSTVFCFLELQFINVMLQNINIPVWDLLVSLSPAWSKDLKAKRG